MIKHSRRRKPAIPDYTKLRLELFFFDEIVQEATESLLYLESHQGSQSGLP